MEGLMYIPVGLVKGIQFEKTSEFSLPICDSDKGEINLLTKMTTVFLVNRIWGIKTERKSGLNEMTSN